MFISKKELEEINDNITSLREIVAGNEQMFRKDIGLLEKLHYDSCDNFNDRIKKLEDKLISQVKKKEKPKKKFLNRNY